MSAMASQITSLTIVYSTVYSSADQRKHQSSALLAFVRGIHRWPVNSPHKWPVTRKTFPIDDVIMQPLQIPGLLRNSNIGYLSETSLKLKSWEISFIHKICYSCQIVLEFCTEHDSTTVVLCTKFQNDWVSAEIMTGKDISRDLSLKLVSNGYPILHKAPSLYS